MYDIFEKWLDAQIYVYNELAGSEKAKQKENNKYLFALEKLKECKRVYKKLNGGD